MYSCQADRGQDDQKPHLEDVVTYTTIRTTICPEKMKQAADT
jgi:hypothetical protein